MEFKQSSFSGGINLLLDDTRLPVSFKYKEGDSPYDITYNQYRIGLNTRTRFDVCTPIKSSITDLQAPPGIKQAIVSFGNYIILFVQGTAWYKLNTDTNWTEINDFSMSQVAPRYWTVAVPLTTTLYGRLAGQTIIGTTSTTTGSDTATTNTYGTVSAALPITQINQIAAGFANIPGLLVQDGINQPWFIYINQSGNVVARQTQTYDEWSYPLDPTTLQLTGPDEREYVPIGTYMEWFNGILFIVDNNFTYIYRSVSGRPLDFVVNVDENGQKGGDARTTSYSVGVAGISAMQALPGNILFIAAGGATNFGVTLNTTPNAPTIFGEYTFLRTVLFNANCITERGIVNVLGDTVFIDANGLRSFNSVEQQQNEGRNSVFSSTVQGLFTGIFQTAMVNNQSTVGWCSAIDFDNYAIFSVNTVMGYVLVVYDTINNVYSSIDTLQLGNHAAKQFAAITISTLALYAITDDDRVVQLYADDVFDQSLIRLGSLCSQDPKKEMKIAMVRAVMSNITSDMSITASIFVNNRLSDSVTTKINYSTPVKTYIGANIGNDVGTQVSNILFTFPNSAQGWKVFVVLTWTGGASLTDVSAMTTDLTPLQPLQSQAVINNK